MLDFRSDTLTLPTDSMRQAMFEAEVGDDVCGEDPTVNEIEANSAELLGKDAALFLPSGTMGNQIAIHCHTRGGEEVIVGDGSHIVQHEAGASALLSRVQLRTVAHGKDHLSLDDIKSVYRFGSDIHYPTTGLICIEQASAFGTVMALEELNEIKAFASKRSTPVHMDGARFFNACVAKNWDPKDLAACADSVTFCLSKGLSAPVGSVLVGETDFINKARRFRKVLGGGMRQAGVLAAAGLVALKTQSQVLHEDHEKAQKFAAAMIEVDHVKLAFEADINMVFLTLTDPSLSDKNVLAKLEASGCKTYPRENGLLRFVFNRHHTTADVDTLIEAMRSAVV